MMGSIFAVGIIVFGSIVGQNNADAHEVAKPVFPQKYFKNKKKGKTGAPVAENNCELCCNAFRE
jgi:hypothetical protein